MNITDEYIELCKNEKIQELRPTTGKYNAFQHGISGLKWLPTGDELDDKIIEICDKNNLFYNFSYEYDFQAYQCSCGGYDFVSDNPLVAKVKLLIKLLESQYETI